MVSDIQWVKDSLFKNMVLGKYRRVKLYLCLTPYTKINSKWIKHLNLTPETIELLEGNTEGNFITLDLAKGSLDRTPKAQATKVKVRQIALHQN